MVWFGFKFGLSFCLGIGAFTVFLMALIFVGSWVSDWLSALKRTAHRLKRTAHREKHVPKQVEWKRASTSAPRDDGTIQSFSFCSVIRWDNEEDQVKRRHRDGVR
jgi:hypothetical protein